MFYQKAISIDNIEYRGINIHFLRIGELMAWYFDKDEKRYGDYVKIEGNTMEEVFTALTLQAKETIDFYS